MFIGADSSGNAEPHPTVNVRAGLLGLVSRSVFYQLAELVVNRADTAVESAINSALDSAVDSSVDSAAGKIGEHSTQSLGIWSSGVFFALA